MKKTLKLYCKEALYSKGSFTTISFFYLSSYFFFFPPSPQMDFRLTQVGQSTTLARDRQGLEQCLHGEVETTLPLVDFLLIYITLYFLCFDWISHPKRNCFAQRNSFAVGRNSIQLLLHFLQTFPSFRFKKFNDILYWILSIFKIYSPAMRVKLMMS